MQPRLLLLLFLFSVPLFAPHRSTAQQLSQLVAVGIAKSNDHVYYWFSDTSVTSGTTDNPLKYQTRVILGNWKGKKLVAAAIAKNDHVYYWWSDGTVSSGTTTDPRAYRNYYRFFSPHNRIADLIAVGIAGSDDHVYYWWSDGTVSSGTTDDPTRYRAPYLSNVTSQLIDVDIAGNDHVYYWYANGLVSSGTTDDPTKYRGYYGSNLVR